MRVSELVALDLKQYKGKYPRNIKWKGKKVTRELLLAKPAREALGLEVYRAVPGAGRTGLGGPIMGLGA
jgi:hypothetical protein